MTPLAAPGTPASAPSDGLILRIPAMDCAVEETQIRAALDPVDGIAGLSFALVQRTLTIQGSAAAQAQAQAAIRAQGFDFDILQRPVSAADADRQSRRQAIRLGIALLLALLSEVLAFWLGEQPFADAMGWRAATMLPAAAAILLAGFSTYRKGVTALSQGKLNINTLMSVAVTGAFAIGQWPEAAMVMALYAIAELIEARAVDRARNAVRHLLDLAPDTTEVRLPSGEWQTRQVQDVGVGDIIRVRPGGRVALDGIITDGHSALDQSSVTGESMPVDKSPGDGVFAGTINSTATLEIRTTAVSSDSTLSRIIREVETAQSRRAPTQQFVDRFAAIYTPLVFVLALVTILWQALGAGQPWLSSVYTGLVLLVIACPCALVIATPVTVVSALANAARRGILIKGGVYLETAHGIRAIALDKTGTITEGKPRLLARESLAALAQAGVNASPENASVAQHTGIDNADSTALPSADADRWAAALAGASDHPVSQAIAAGLSEHGIAADGASLSAFTALPGRGVRATLDGQELWLGNHRLIEELGLCGEAIEARLHVHEAQGRTVTLLANGSGVLALYAVADAIRPASRQAIAELHALDVRTIMLSGDNQTAASAIAAQAGIDEAIGDLLPDDKLRRIQAMQQQHGMTAMTGDGINDAPALAQADIGIAMGRAGTDIAMETADVVLMNDDLRRIPETMRLSRRTRTVLMQNITLALGIKLVFMALAYAGMATMWMAVFADMGASLLVVFNGLRLVRGPGGTSSTQ